MKSKFSKEWIEAAAVYESAANAVRRADHDMSISDDTYGDLVEAREQAFANLRSIPSGVTYGGKVY